MDEKLVKQFTKFIYPFWFGVSNKDNVNLDKYTYTTPKGKDCNIFERIDQKSTELRDGLDDLLCIDGGSAKIADCYKVNQTCRKLFNLPKRPIDYVSFYIRPTGEEVKYDVAITDVKVYIFESGVGLIEIDCEYKSDNLDDYYNLNYFISEIKSDKNYFSVDEISYDEQTKTRVTSTKNFSIKQIIDSILGYIENNKEEKENSKIKYTVTKLIIYSYILLNKKPENMYGILYNARKNYKQSYQAPLSEYRFADDENVLQQFQNSYWAASENGAVNMSFLMADETTDNFFKSEFISRLNTTYFSLFIHTLHQKYALLAYMGEMGKLDKLDKDYCIMKKELKRAQQIHLDAVNLRFRAFFKFPSFVEHINNYFNLIQKSLNVTNIYDHFTTELANLTDICDTYVERIKARDTKIKQKNTDYKDIFTSIVAEIVAIVLLFNSSWSLIEKIIGHSVSIISVSVLTLMGTICSSAVPVVISVINKIKDIRSIKKSLKEEVDENLVEDDKLRKLRKKMRAKKKKLNKE
jgi:hypothetical protein